MPDKLGNDFVHYTADGIFFYDSSSILTPSTSQSSLPQITQITCSADFGNNIATTGSLSGYFVLPLMTGSPAATNQIESQLNVVYNTGSFFTVSASNESFHYNPTSSTDIINYNLFVEIEKNDSSNLVASKTYSALTGSIIYSGVIGTDGNAMGYNYISASLTGSAITIFNVFSQSIHPVFISASGFTSNILQSGSYGSGSFVNYLAPQGTLLLESSSLVIARDAEDTTQSSFIFRVQSGSFGGTEHRDILYISASEGKIGLGTTDPLTDVDIRANEFQIQRKTERKGLKINNEGNIESFSSDAASAATGSEFLLRYSRGIEITPAFMTTFVDLEGDATGSNNTNAVTLFGQLRPDVQARALTAAEVGGKIRPPAIGDTLGSIRWIAESGSTTGYNKRTTGETAVVKAVVSDVNTTGVQADLVFSVAGKGGAATQKFLIDAGGYHQITGSLEISNDLVVKDDANITDDLTVGGDITANGNIIGDGATQLSGLTHITAIGNMAFGNHASNDDHTITGRTEIVGNITASGNISASHDSKITAGTGSFRRLHLGDTTVSALSADLHIRNAGSVNVNLDSYDQNGNQVINFLNNQEPDWSIGNYFSDGGFQIKSDLKAFAIFGANDGDIIELSGSLNVTGSNGHIVASGNISASGVLQGNYITAKTPIVQLSSHNTFSSNTSGTGDINQDVGNEQQLSWTVTDFSDTDYFTVSGSWGIGVKQTGRYKLSAHAKVYSTGGARPGCVMQFYTGSSFGAAADYILPPEYHTYLRVPSAAVNKANIDAFNYIVQLNSGSFVSTVCGNKADYGGGAVVRFSGSASYFNIEYLG